MPRAKTTAPVLDPLDAPSAEDGLTRLQLTGIRDHRWSAGHRSDRRRRQGQQTGGEDSLLDEAARANLSARETLALLCEREIARKDHRRIDTPLQLGPSNSPTSRLEDLSSFDVEAQPSIDPRQIRRDPREASFAGWLRSRHFRHAGNRFKVSARTRPVRARRP